MTFEAPLLITILDLLLLTGQRRVAARHGVVAAITTWAVITLGSALNILGLDVFPVGVGFWAQLVCVGVAIDGALLLMTDPVEDDASLPDAITRERLGPSFPRPPDRRARPGDHRHR